MKSCAAIKVCQWYVNSLQQNQRVGFFAKPYTCLNYSGLLALGTDYEGLDDIVFRS